MPVLSVIMAVYNHEALCGAALACILRHTLQDLEVLVVDDGSTDDSYQAVARAAEGDPRVTILRRRHAGIAAALRLAVGAAQGRYLARMDADDLCSPTRLERQVALLEQDEAVGAVDCLTELLPSAVTGRGMMEHVDWLNSLVDPEPLHNSLFIESPLVHPAVTMRRAAYEAAGGYLDEPGPEDYSLWLRMVKAGYRLGKLPSRLFQWRDLPGRLTRTSDDYSQTRMLELKARHLPAIVPAAAEQVQIWGAGRAGRRFARCLADEGVEVTRFFDIDPSKIGSTVRGRPVLHLDELRANRDVMTLVAVGVRSAKPKVRAWAVENGFIEGRDFLFVA